jgi:phosphate starvation-inducible PhoH-like protein
VSDDAPAGGDLSFDDNDVARSLFGQHGENLRVIERMLGVRLHSRGGAVRVEGEDFQVDLARKVLEALYEVVREGYPLYATDVEQAVKIVSADDRASLKSIFLDTVFISAKKRVIAPKTIQQKEYIDAIRRFDIVIGIGPAGTGKTYLAMAAAVNALSLGQVDRIILTRPAVEAGEKLGFLPGDLVEKVNPYLRPLYDALHDMMHFEKAQRLIERGSIEVAPLAFMRGRTLNDAFVILDEAQNTTSEQMKMFLTRLGFRSKAVVTGDITQIDLAAGQRSGLIEIQHVLAGIPGIRFVRFTDKDVVRHRLVQEIVLAYEAYDRERKREKGGQDG